ncbi:exported hypothetical protein [Magnetospirillum molischianum DSM 120]|uniref:Uncharacterized protein n=1 Tax=Magnetospirillum molischianum DSM 120 TaxID=1150626 RepID=H8FNS1_MAGML|nr:exported hypothetical protein [Magnetospirillum molischianum DSM 120]
MESAMYPNWILRISLCFVLLAQLPGAFAELVVSAAEGELIWMLVHSLAVIGDFYFCYKIIRDGID